MIKLLFFDWRYLEQATGFERKLERPVVRDKPVLVSDAPWERNYIATYGSVVRRGDGLYQMWYTCGGWSGEGLRHCYAESDDGLSFRRPPLGLTEKHGVPTNVLVNEPRVGLAVILDEREPRPDRRYKMLTGTGDRPRISAFASPDGRQWLPMAENPVMGVNPDGPIGLHRAADGRYVAYHRPCWGDRRIARSESWDFVHWTPPRVVLEPEAADGTNVQFYGLGAVAYGPFELGTLWVYHTDPTCMGWTKGLGRTNQELVYGRGGTCWHRAMTGAAWIDNAPGPDSPGYGLVQSVSSPMLLDDEIRFYFTRSFERHGEDRLARRDRPERQVCVASSRSDRFVAATCSNEGTILTRPFWHSAPRIFLNARCRPGGYIRAAVTDVGGQPLPAFVLGNSIPFTGDEVAADMRWTGVSDLSVLNGKEIRVRLEVRNADLFAISAATAQEVTRYDTFREPYFLPKELETHAKSRQ